MGPIPFPEYWPSPRLKLNGGPGVFICHVCPVPLLVLPHLFPENRSYFSSVFWKKNKEGDETTYSSAGHEHWRQESYGVSLSVWGLCPFYYLLKKSCHMNPGCCPYLGESFNLYMGCSCPICDPEVLTSFCHIVSVPTNLSPHPDGSTTLALIGVS